MEPDLLEHLSAWHELFGQLRERGRGARIRLVGLDKRKRIGFELKINGADWTWGWNAYPFEFAGMRFR